MLGDRFTLEYSPQFYDEISDAVREELLAFLDFLIFRQKQAAISRGTASSDVTTDPSRRHAGGITGDFFIASDFDEPLECFKEYM